MVKPATVAWAKENRWSPTQAIGRYERMSSWSVSLSNCMPPRAAEMKASCVWHTPFGLPVVPEV